MPVSCLGRRPFPAPERCREVDLSASTNDESKEARNAEFSTQIWNQKKLEWGWADSINIIYCDTTFRVHLKIHILFMYAAVFPTTSRQGTWAKSDAVKDVHYKVGFGGRWDFFLQTQRQRWKLDPKSESVAKQPYYRELGCNIFWARPLLFAVRRSQQYLAQERWRGRLHVDNQFCTVCRPRWRLSKVQGNVWLLWGFPYTRKMAIVPINIARCPYQYDSILNILCSYCIDYTSRGE